MRKSGQDHSYSWGSKFIDRHPVAANFVIICIIAVLGIYAAYLATAIFTKHGRSTRLPGVENMSYTEAVNLLHSKGFKVDIRDSLYREDVKPGFVIEQFPNANSIVKPGRKIFLYINAVHPKEVILDDDNHPNEFALKGQSYRSALAKLEELGFKNVRVVKVLGTTDRVVKVMANGRPVHKMQKIPVTSTVVLEISDGRLADVQDSLRNAELLQNYQDNPEYYGGSSSDWAEDGGNSSVAPPSPASTPDNTEDDDESSQYF